LLRLQRLGDALGLSDLWAKDEGLNPTGSFKARGMAVAVARAVELGARRLAAPTAGNAGVALAAYAARAGIRATVALPVEAPASASTRMRDLGADVVTVEGSIADAGQRLRSDPALAGAFDVATLREPYRVEGKKTMAFEIAEQFAWTLPSVIVYPTGGGTGIVGMRKGFAEMGELGWISGPPPRFLMVQAEGCAPLVRAFHAGERFAVEWENPRTVAAGLRVPKAIGDFLILDAVRESKGTAVTVSDDEMLEAERQLAAVEGLGASHEAAATLAGLRRAQADGSVAAEDRILLLLTGSALTNV
jgi:threonine synthase